MSQPAESVEAEWVSKFDDWIVRGPDATGEFTGYCPMHEDPDTSGSPSGSFNFKKGMFYCHVCEQGMGIAGIYAIAKEEERERQGNPSANVSSMDRARDKKRGKTVLPSEEQIASWRSALQKSQTALSKLKEKRGLSDSTIEKFEIGFNVSETRYTIPIRAEDGELLNVRRYKIDAPSNKMIGVTGHNGTELFPRPVLSQHDEVVLCEGEMDALIGNQFGFPTVTATGGAKRMPDEIAQLFDGKTVFVCYDADDAGRVGGSKAAKAIQKYAAAVYLIRLPLQGKEDLTDYFVGHGYTPNEFRALIEETRQEPFGEKEYTSRVDAPAKPVTLESSMSAEHGNEPLEMVVTVAGKVQPAYLLPKKVVATCDQDYGKACAKCPMSLLHNGQATKDIAKDNPLLLELVEVSKSRSDTVVKTELLGAPARCDRLQIDEDELWNVEELVVMPSVEDRTEDIMNPISRKVYNVGEYATPINTISRVVGVNTTDPKTRRSVLQSWDCEPTKTNLDSFEMSDELFEQLQVFNPKAGQTPVDKMREIAKDLERNVTEIYGRPEMHIAYDLVWHSAMGFKFRGTKVDKGWLELLVMGDTRTGKSAAAEKLCHHYQAGVLKSCEGATLAGLVGGAQQTGNSWMITWGTIPLNDRRLVVLDEASGIADKNIIEQMSAVRSSGRAMVTKIVSQETSARTRLIWISNPPDGRPIESMPRGAIEAVGQLIKNPEDIARYDIAMSAASADVDSSVINTFDHASVKHVYTQELCSKLVGWVWSRKVEDIEWAEGSESRVLEVAEKMGHEYIPEPPLVQAENIRVKLARIAVAIAARLFSADDTGERIVVEAQHVDAAVELLNRFYNMKSFGYADHSKKTLRNRRRAEENRTETLRYLAGHEDVLNSLLACLGGDFKVRDFEDFAGMSRDEAQIAVQELMKLRMLRRMSKGYIRMENALVQLLKDLEDVDD